MTQSHSANNRDRLLSSEEIAHTARLHPSLANLMDRHRLTAGDLEEILRALRFDKLSPNVLTDHVPHVIVGQVRDIKTYADGRVEDTGWAAENLVVNSFAILLAALCYSTRSPAWPGITYMALGQGDPSWDTSLPSPLPTDTMLFSEIVRKPLDQIQDIDSLGNVVNTGPTGNLLLTCTFSPNEAIATIREYGLFGGIGASGSNGGTMVNHTIHGAIVKSISADFTFTRQARLFF